MSFRQNLEIKMKLDRLAATVSQSMGTQVGTRKVNKDAMRDLLALSPYTCETRRDLELYIRPLDQDQSEVLVLDNELPLYTHTTAEDVALRRSPELKEMISIRNIIKILNDSDILSCKGQEAVQHVYRRSLERLDLRYEKADIEKLEQEARQGFLGGDPDKVIEILSLFVEILNYEYAPAEFTVNDYLIFGPAEHPPGVPPVFRHLVMYNEKTNELKLISHRIEKGSSAAQELVHTVAEGTTPPDMESAQVLRFLTDETMKQKPPTVH